MLIMLLTSEIVLNFYSPLESIKVWMRPILYVFSIGIVGSLLIACQNMLMRLVGKTHHVIGIMLFTFIVVGGVMSVV